jgi:hypothetical protein
MNFILNIHNKKLIDITFPNLLIEHKKIIIDSLNDIFVVLLKTIFYNKEENFIKQMTLNNSRDILGFVTLLLPYFDFSSKDICLKIKSLDDIFKDPNPNEKIYQQNLFKSTYYIDHNTSNYKLKEYKYYFYNNTQKIINTIHKVKHKLLPNWLNIFPYNYKNLEDLKKIDLYKNLKTRFVYHLFDEKNNNLDIGNDTLYGTITNFLYNDIYRIKWMIYDYYEGNTIYPSIIHICELLNINNILVEKDYIESEKLDQKNKMFFRLSKERQEILINIWNNVISNQKNINDLTNLLLFFLKININKINNLKISKECKSFFKNNEELKNENEFIDKIEENYFFEKDNSKFYIKELINNIEYADIYDYIFECLHQFRYTWYGFMCITGQNIVNNKIDYYYNFTRFFFEEFNDVKKKDEVITNFFSLKLFYNYFKSLIHFNIKNTNATEYIKIGNTWDEMHIDTREYFIKRLNEKDENNKSWFNIPNNLRRIPMIESSEIEKIMIKLRFYLFNTSFIPKIIIATLIYNGILTEFIYNPEITNKNELPDKNNELNNYIKKIKDKLKIKEYEDSYNFLSNTQYKNIPNSCENIKNSFWYDNFGGDWVAQIQIYHHFINQRFMIITAVTGAGKSTVIPFILLYALKILNYNNNCKLVCSAPRIGPTVKNAKRISDSLGYRYQETIEINQITKKEKKKIKKEIITYIQFKHAAEDTVDDLFHPKLRFITDGALYQEIKDKYLFKVNIEKNVKNLFDILLIDEAHEHNTYIDLILTMARNNIYLNNQITLGVVSATIDYDEPIYRKYFYNVNDNLKFPLKFNEFDPKNIEEEEKRLDSNLIDRRINIGAPYTGTNFTITEKFVKNINEQIILKEIYNLSKKDDILLFKAGTSDIIETVQEINKNSPEHVYAIPFYKDLDPKILENVQNMNKDIRINNFNFPKNREITEIFKDSELLKPGTYTQFVIVATNIAEASITIDSLGFVIDDGEQKTSYYDYDIRNKKLIKEQIANPNRLQRKGRIGRVKPGTIYYTYLSSRKDFKDLKLKVQYKICIENITTYIINLINNKIETIKEIDEKNDPSIIREEIVNLPDYIKNQYIYKFINEDTQEIKIFSYYYLVEKYIEKKNKRDNKVDNVYYPYTDSRYDINDIIDEKGNFFIIHPNDDDLIRDKKLDFINVKTIDKKNYIVKLDYEGNIILNNNKPIILKEYKNKIELIINILKEYLLLDDKNNITNIGKLIQDIISEELIQKTESVLCILDIIKNYQEINYDYIIFLIIFMEGITFKLSEELKKKYINIKSDIIGIINIFPKKLLNELLLYDIISYKNTEKNIKEKFESIDKEITVKSFKIIKKYFEKINISDEDLYNLEAIFIKYNKIKIRIEIYKDRFRLFDRYEKIKEKYPDDIFKDIEKNKNKLFEEDIVIIEKFKSDKTNILYNKNNIIIGKNIEVNIYSAFEKMCYFAAKYYKTNMVINIPRTIYYLNYFYPNVNSIYQINNFKNKKTNIDIYYRLNYILYCNNNENIIDIITFIPTKILNKIIKDEQKKIIKDNISINLEYIKENYTDYNYKKILKKIDIIIQYVNSIK